MSTTVAVISLAIIAILGIVFGIINFFYWRYRAKKERDCINKVYYKQLEKDYLARIEEKYKSTTDGIYEKENKLKEELSSLEKEIDDKKSFNDNLFKIREEELDRLIEEKKKEKFQLVEREVEDWARSAQEAATENFQKWNLELAQLREKMENNYFLLKEEVDDYQEKRNVINQEILRSRAMEEKEDFYKLQLDADSKHDLEIFSTIISKIIKVETLNKLIYDNYINKSVKELTKRVLGGKNPIGIYKVTNVETKEIYIGKSTNVADRWKNHIKAACGLSGVADSQFQRALKKYGIENFTWELLEETTKEKLSEREKYWISFYDTMNYGYNQRLG